MSQEAIARWAASGESATLEFKKSTAEKDRACRSLCAFANVSGGRVLFGVTPAGKVVGQTVTDRTLEELAQEFQGFEPPLFPTLERVSVDGGREVLVLGVARSSRAPVTFRGVAKTSRFDQGEPFSESWRMERVNGDNQPWLVAGIRQNG